MSKEYTDQYYYWEKAEFQDPVSHRKHVENYKQGIHSSIAFDEEYMVEAMEELKADPVEFIEKVMKINLNKPQKDFLRKFYDTPPGLRYFFFPKAQGRTQAQFLRAVFNDIYGRKYET